MLRQLTTYLILSLVLVNGCAKRKSDFFIDTVHGYLRCNKDMRDVNTAMLEIRREYDIQHLRTENQSADGIQYETSSYLVPGDKELTLEIVAEKGQPIHIKFKMEPGGLYSREEIMIELARRIDVLPNAKPLEVKKVIAWSQDCYRRKLITSWSIDTPPNASDHDHVRSIEKRQRRFG